jgi:predicted  nucleic acid-binding Zn-ribbon protein
VQEEEGKCEQLRKQLEEERQVVEKRSVEIDALLKDLDSVLKDMETGIPKPVLGKYRRIQGAWKGLAVVEVDVKNGSCGGCHRQIPPQLFNVLLRQETLEQCPHCQRFIFVDVEKLKKPEE